LELVLNLCWLLLLGPGAYLWLRQRRSAKPIFQFSIALACLLFLLFPVISATDDLHALRQEMEESSSSKRTQKQVGKRGAVHDFSAPPAQLASPLSFPPSNLVCSSVLAFSAPVAPSVYPDISAARALLSCLSLN
jgi:HAMP domain-containing protein